MSWVVLQRRGVAFFGASEVLAHVVQEPAQICPRVGIVRVQIQRTVERCLRRVEVRSCFQQRVLFRVGPPTAATPSFLLLAAQRRARARR